MKKWYVLHASLNPAGGGERVAIEVVKALLEAGHKVELVLLEQPTTKVSLQLLHKLRHVRLRCICNSAKPVVLKYTLGSLLSRLLKNKAYVFATTGFYSFSLIPDIIYVHFPFHLALAYRTSLEARHISSINRLYQLVMLNLVDILNVFAKAKVVLYNSDYTLRTTIELLKASKSKGLIFSIRAFCQAKHRVVYPPVDSRYIINKVDLKQKEDIVLLIGRISPEKKYEMLRHVVCKLHEHGVKTKFIVLGATESQEYLSYLRRILSPYNIYFFTDVSEEEKLYWLSKAKVYLHLMPYEHFGISIVEAMAAGAIPIVHVKSGVARFISTEWLYTKYSEIPDKIVAALTKWNTRCAKELMQIAMLFDSTKFREHIRKIVEEVQ